MTRLELTWPNKDRFLLSPKDGEGKPLWVGRDHPAAAEVRVSEFSAAIGDVNQVDPYDDNLLFTGDSLDVLRILTDVPEYRRNYRGKVRLVYIDPPFNTGQAFKHYDDWLEHATWLSFMHERLRAIRDLLTPDGSIWIHLDDVEQHRMRALLDEVFGAGNFITTIIWQKIHARNNSAQHFSADHDFVLVYAKDAARWNPNRIRRTAKSDGDFWNPDDDPRGLWRRSDLTASKPYAEGHYEVIGPHRDVFAPRPGRPWSTSKEKFEELVADNRVWWGKTGRSFPFRKRFKGELGDLVPHTVWLHEEVGNNREAKSEITKLFEKDAFSTPKPERLVERIVHIGSDPGDVVADCFAGSGTTAAVAHKMGRRWVTAESLPETVTAFVRPRLELVVKGEDPGGITGAVGWEGGGGFRCVDVGPSLYVDTPFGVLLSDEATNGTFSKAVAGQLGYEFQANAAPLCGIRGRMRLAVLDGIVGAEEVRAVVAALREDERVEIVGRAVLDDAMALLTSLAKGSKITKAPRDLLTQSAIRTRRRAQREVAE